MSQNWNGAGHLTTMVRAHGAELLQLPRKRPPQRQETKKVPRPYDTDINATVSRPDSENNPTNISTCGGMCCKYMCLRRRRYEEAERDTLEEWECVGGWTVGARWNGQRGAGGVVRRVWTLVHIIKQRGSLTPKNNDDDVEEIGEHTRHNYNNKLPIPERRRQI